MKNCFLNYIKLSQTLYPNFKSMSMSMSMFKLKIVGFNLEIGLRMVANRTNIGSFLSNDNVTAVAALQDHFLVAGEHQAALNVG